MLERESVSPGPGESEGISFLRAWQAPALGEACLGHPWSTRRVRGTDSEHLRTGPSLLSLAF